MARLTLRSGGEVYDLRLAGPDADGNVRLSGVRRNAAGQGVPVADLEARARVGPNAIELVAPSGVLRCAIARAGRGVWVGWRGRSAYFEAAGDARRGAAAAAVSADEVRAPMTGVIVEVRVAPGERVASGDLVAVMEAMKMEYRLLAPCAGEVESVRVLPGERVELGDLVARIARAAGDRPASRDDSPAAVSQ
jgi:acetyl/propionyl-CoA carboxylase alpha subunit